MYLLSILMGILLIPIFLVYNNKFNKADLDIIKVENSIKTKYDLDKIVKDKNLDKFIENFSINKNNIEKCIYYYPSDSMMVEEFFILKYKKGTNKNQILNNIKKYVDKRKSDFLSYGVDQYEILKNYLIYDRSPYIIYIVNSRMKSLNTFINEVLK